MVKDNNIVCDNCNIDCCVYLENGNISYFKDNTIYIDIKSKSIKIQNGKNVSNYNDIEEMKKIILSDSEKLKIKGFDFEKYDNNGYKKLVFCDINCYNNYIK